MQDASLQESMGPIVDRSQEHLVATDRGIIMARRRLHEAALALRDAGAAPPGIDPAHHRVRSVSVILPPDRAFATACRAELSAQRGVAHATV